MNKIGIGITTCNRSNYLRGLLNTLVQCDEIIDELVVVNDGKSINDFDLPRGVWIENETNLGVGRSKNKAIEYLMAKGCKYIFLLEDDIIIKDKEVFNKYIKASQVSGIQHFNFAFHGIDNYNPDSTPATRLKVEYSKDVAVCLYPNVYGAFSFYTRKCIEEVGYMDNFYYNAMEHVDHTNEIIKKNMHPPFRWFADIADSQNYISEIDQGHSGSEIRRDETWVQNFHKAADYFAKKQGFDVRVPSHTASKDKVIETLNIIKRTYGEKNTGH